MTAACVAAAVLIGLAGCGSPVHQRASGWLVVETSHIQLRTNIGRGAAVRLASEMQRSYDVLARHALPCAPGGNEDRVQVTVLPVWQFDQYTPTGARGFYRSAGVTWLADHDGQVVLPDDLGLESQQVFLHELTHRLVESCFVRAPPWLHEGLAGFFETMLVASDRLTIGRPTYAIKAPSGRRVLRSVIADGQRLWIMSIDALPSLETLFGLTGWRTHDWRETAPRYATAWALVHLLVLGAPDLAPRFRSYLSGLQHPDADPRELFVKLFEGVPLQDRLNEYSPASQPPRRGDPGGFATPASPPGHPAPPRWSQGRHLRISTACGGCGYPASVEHWVGDAATLHPDRAVRHGALAGPGGPRLGWVSRVPCQPRARGAGRGDLPADAGVVVHARQPELG